MSDEKEIRVSICCITYNHKNYISQCINSLLMQRADFGFEIIIGEDCSADGTREIVFDYQKKHPEIIKLIISETNIGSYANELRVLQACKGKYIAYCEGDDYWTDPYKLQKQVDFLEANPDYGLVHGDVNHLDQKTGKIIKANNKTNNIKIPNGNIFEFLMKPSHSIKTMTTCFRRDLIEKHYLSNNEIMKSDWAFIDISIWLMFAYHSKIYYFNEVFATYRLLPWSASRTKSPKKLHQFHLKIYNVFLHYSKNYTQDLNIKREVRVSYYKMLMNDAYNLGDKKMQQKAVGKLKNENYQFDFKERVKIIVLNYLKIGWKPKTL